MEWRIFFIGPMGKEESVDYSEHLPMLHAHIVDHLMSEKHGYTRENKDSLKKKVWKNERREGTWLKKGTEKITTITPFALYGAGAIPENVFDTIDDSDLIIADLSGNKPSVIYELAFAHALGIRTIIVGSSQEVSYYFSQSKITDIQFQPNQISSASLDKEIDRWLEDKTKRFNSKNPLTEFYGAPLPDISAATGLAAGFYDNFARPILASGEIVERMPDGSEEVRELKGLIVLHPENFEQKIGQVEKNLRDKLESSFSGGVKRGRRGELVIQTKDGERIPTFLVEDYMIDVPRTMFSLALSPRLERSTKSKKAKSLRENMERVLVGRFFETVKDFLVEDRYIEEEEEKFHYGTIEEIPEIIKTGKSKTWKQD